MTQKLTELVRAFEIACANEAMISDSEHASPASWQKAKERLNVCRVELIGAIEELERKAGL